MSKLDLDPFEARDRAMQEAAKGPLDDSISVYEEYVKYASGSSDLQSWVELNRIIYGKPFSYDNADMKMILGNKDKKLTVAPRPYLTQYIKDQCDDKTCIKCRQSEFSETEINENIWMCCTIPHLKVRHLFPTAGVGNQMAKEKIGPAMLHSPNIAKMIKKPIALTSKEFVNGSFYTIDSSFTETGGRGPSGDVISFDEYESQNPQIEEIYSESLTHSRIGRKKRISTPLLPGSGIDERYNMGCKFEWIIVCPKCKKKQIMSFPENIINYFEASLGSDLQDPDYMNKLKKVYLGCRYCAAYIDRTSKQYLDTASWVAEKKHLIPVRTSYRVTYMMLPWKTGMEIMSKFHSFKFKHQFWNEIMGYGYVDPASIITRNLFESCISNAYRNSERPLGMARNVSIGVDWGIVSWVVIRANGFQPNPKYPRVIYVERIDEASLKEHGYQGRQEDHWKRVADLVIQFKAKIVVNDANGIGVDRNSNLVNKFPTRAWGCFYDTNEIEKQKKKQALIIPNWVEKSRRVTVSRLSTFKLLVQEYEKGKPHIVLPALDPEVDEFITHHAALVIQKMADEKTGEVFEIVGHTGADHFAHADNYSKVGFEYFVNPERESNVGVINPIDRGADTEDINKYVGQPENPDLE